MVDTSELSVQSPELGAWHFILFGVGRVPTKFALMDIYAELGTLRNAHISFANPFKH
jgi:hypothetical protein